MKLEQSFEVAAPIDAVWRALIDVERVAPCLPGATIERRDDDGVYHGSFQVKLGPTTAAYRGTIKLTEADESRHVATLEAKGSDKRGQGGASATIVNTLRETAPGTTRVEADSDVTITGRLARFGRPGMIEDISARLMREFAARLQEQLRAEGVAASEGAAGSEGATAAGEAGEAGRSAGAAVGAGGHDADGTGDAAGTGESAGARDAAGTGAGDTGETGEAAGTGAGESTGATAASTAGAAAAAASGSNGGAAAPAPTTGSALSAPAEPIGGFGLVLGAAGDRLRRSPAAIAALFAAVGALLVLLAQRARRD